VKLLSNILGPFDEVFCWNIKGCSDDLTLQFRGRVAGPEFEIDPPKLDFGLVSYGFRYTT
jgi:hydrocephalus-inducing protein